MLKLIRSPITWMVGAEVVVVGALIGLAWHVVASSGKSVLSPPAVVASGPADETSSPLPQLPVSNPLSMRGPLPGLNADPLFWRDRLAHLNADQVYLEQLEWRIVHSAEDAAQHYLDNVVLPAIRRAEHAAGGGAVS